MKSTHKATKEERIREQLWRGSKEVWSKLPASPHMDAEIQGTG